VSANLLAASVDDAKGRVFNIGTGRYTRIHRLWEAIQDISGCRRTPEFLPERPGDIRESVADIAQARYRLGFQPVCPFENGLAATYHWYRDLGP